MTDPTPKAVVVPQLVDFMRGGTGSIALGRELFAEIERRAKSKETKYEALSGTTEKTLYSSPAATQSLLDDPHIDLFEWLCDEASDALGAQAGGTFTGDWSIQSATLLRDPYAAKPYVLFYVQAEAAAAPQASLPPVGGVRRTMTLSLTDAEMAALEELVNKKDLDGPRIFRNSFRLYQAVEKGAASVTWHEIGPLSPPALSPVPSGGGEPVMSEPKTAEVKIGRVTVEEASWIENEIRLCAQADKLGIRRVMDVSPDTIAALAHTVADLQAENDVLSAMLAASPPAETGEGCDTALREHFKAMQRMASAYLVPEDYRDRDGKVTLHGDHNNTDQWKQGQRGFRAEAFAGDMIYMLDGPEERAALSAVQPSPLARELEHSAIAAIAASSAAPVPAVEAGEEEAYEIGKRDGYEAAVADIDRMTGGDGEYVFSTLPGEGCPDANAMKSRIVERYTHPASDQSDTERMRAAISVMELALKPLARAINQSGTRPNVRMSGLDAVKIINASNKLRAALAEKAADK